LVTAGDRTFWDGVVQAAGADPRDARAIRGASGLDHAVAAVGVDEARRRLIVISSAPDPRSAAMAQTDIQALMSNVAVVVARPVVVDMSAVAREVGAAVGKTEFGSADLGRIPKGETQAETDQLVQAAMQPYLEQFGPAIKSVIGAVGVPAVGFLGGALQMFEQLRTVQFSRSTSIGEDGEEITTDFKVEFASLAEEDALAADLRLGVCPLPLFRFSEQELELVSAAPSADQVRDLLEKHDILPYFFPPADHLALGLIDREQPSVESLLPQIETAPAIGHPLGKNEILPPGVALPEVLTVLKEMGLAIEGEQSVELTDEGLAVRTTVKFSPREGLVSKVLNRVNINLNPADWFRP
jgi:hypothetical protein